MDQTWWEWLGKLDSRPFQIFAIVTFKAWGGRKKRERGRSGSHEEFRIWAQTRLRRLHFYRTLALVRYVHINLHRCRAASAALSTYMIRNFIDMALVQKLWMEEFQSWRWTDEDGLMQQEKSATVHSIRPESPSTTKLWRKLRRSYGGSTLMELCNYLNVHDNNKTHLKSIRKNWVSSRTITAATLKL